MLLQCPAHCLWTQPVSLSATHMGNNECCAVWTLQGAHRPTCFGGTALDLPEGEADLAGAYTAGSARVAWSPAHRQWCMLLGFSASLLRVLGPGPAVEREVRVGAGYCVGFTLLCKSGAYEGHRSVFGTRTSCPGIKEILESCLLSGGTDAGCGLGRLITTSHASMPSLLAGPCPK